MLVHRDVSARNVCRTENGRAKLLDFGALSPMGPPRELIGTPPFLCPESLEQRPLDARADLFSLGALAYHALTGRHAYPAARIADLGDVWARPVTPPSTFAEDLPASLDALVLSLIALDPLVRPTSAAEVCHRLTTIADLAAAEAPETARAYFLTPGLVARQEQIRRFRRLLARALRGRGGSVLIESPRGGGRSRLLSSFLTEARLKGALVAVADAEHGPPHPFGVVRALARSLRDADPALARELMAADPELGSVLAMDTASESGEGVVAAEMWIAATEKITRWLVDTSRKRAVVVGIDGFEVCDGPSAAVIASVSAMAGEESMLVVATSPADSTDPSVVRLRAAGYSLSLKPLGAADTRELLSTVFGDVPHLEKVAEWVHSLSRGLPRPALDLAQHLVNAGVARYEEGGWVLPATLEGLDLPDGMDAALDARIAGLGEGARRIAEALALTCNEDPLLVTEYAALFDEGTKAEIFLHLNELVSNSVLVDGGSSYVFANNETRDAVLRRVPSEALPGLHSRIARAYLSGVSGLGNGLAAHHLLLAGDAASAFQVMSKVNRRDIDPSVRGIRYFRTSEAADTVERLYKWGRENRLAATDVARISQILLLLASSGQSRLVHHAPELLAAHRYDAGLDLWEALGDVADPVERIQQAIMGAYARFASAPDRDQHLEPGEAIEQLGVAGIALVGAYARNLDQVNITALARGLFPLRVLSPALQLIESLVDLSAAAVRGSAIREKRLRVIEQSAVPVPGIDEGLRSFVHVLSRYYLALDDVQQGLPVADDVLAVLDEATANRPLAWQVRMLRAYYQGDEALAEECRRRRDLAMTGRPDVDGHLETSLAHEAVAYGALGNLMALKRLLPALDERSKARPGWRPYYHYALGTYHCLRGDHESGVEEYERGLATPGVEDTHGELLLVVGLVRALAELKRFEEAREKAQIAFVHAAREPLQPLDIEELEIALARVEAGLGEVENAIRRAECGLARIQERGLSGVVLVNLLVEHALFAEQVGDRAKVEAITQRVGKIASGVKSTALAGQHARLLAMRRSATFETVQGSVGGLLRRAVHTDIARSIRTELEQCRGSSERTRVALELLLKHAGASRGFLYVDRSGRLQQAAAVPEGEAPATLDDQVAEWIASTSVSDAATATASLEELSSASQRTAFSFFELLVNVGDEVLLAGIAAMEPPPGAALRVPSEILCAVGEELIRAGDASGRAALGKAK